MEINHNYNVELFKEKGFIRKKCKECNQYFWTLDENRETCGDSPCDKYSFIGKPITKKQYSYNEMVKEFLNFFNENGHTPIKRYPVTARRWRDDILLTIASIAVFQPWVTKGIVEPIANPLVIAQPCIRLNDIDNVGKTGRHLTCFTMGGHHAFNNPNDFKYWTDKTVELCFNFFTKLGIDEKSLTFIESWWEGGGNAGPCYEVITNGVELATLVFMQYEKTEDGQYKEMDLKIVDTGYGIERIAWASKGTPNVYEAVFENIVNKLIENSNININSIDKNILGESATLAGLMDIENVGDLRILREQVAKKLNMEVNKLDEMLTPIENIYAIADHTRCIAFMLGDGIVPSNVKDGYLVRLLIRKTLRYIKSVGLNNNLSLVNIVNMQLEDLKEIYPELMKMKNYINDVLIEEENKYNQTITKGKGIVERLIKSKNKITLEDLIDLYDSKGLPPEVVKDIVDELNSKNNNNNINNINNINNNKNKIIEVNIPDNFYTIVAEKHENKKEKVDKTKSKNIDLDLSHIPQTQLLFYENPYLKETEGKILKIINNNIILDKTIFYPEGGGQKYDIGHINNKEVINVQKIDNIVIHTLNNVEGLKEGQNVNLKLNWENRINTMRNHTATHIVNYASSKVLGNHIWQTGSNVDNEKGRLDITHYKRISREEIKKIEEEANKLVLESIPISSQFLNRNDAEKKYGFKIYQGGVVPGNILRILSIDTMEVEACGGTHCTNTSEVGYIKILKTERIQDGVERLEYTSGINSVKEVGKLEDILLNASNVVGVHYENLPKTVNRFFEEWKEQKKLIKELQKKIGELEKGNLSEDFEEINNYKLLIKEINGSPKELMSLADNLVNDVNNSIVILMSNGHILCKCGNNVNINMGELLRKIAKGGGRDKMAQGKYIDSIEVIKNKVIDILSS